MKKLYMKKLGLLVFMSWIAVFTMVAQTTTWYAINSGDWDNPENWTLDPAGIVYQNPGGTGFPQNGDNIFIKNGVDITVPVKVEPLVLAGGVLTVNGSIDFLTTAGHSFSEIRGTGRILLGADNFPDGPSTHFTSQNQGEGTVVFKGNQDIVVGKNLSFYNLEIDLEATKNLVLGANVNVNGHLHIKNGGLKMGNDGSSRTLIVLGDIIVNQTGRILTATTGIHNIHAFGDILNAGQIKLTNFSVPNYNTISTNYSVLTVKGNSNTKLVADGKVYLHRLVIDKGTDRTYRFTINPVVKENFVLFGRNNIANTDKALYIKNGTLELTGATYIHSLTEGSGDFYVPETGALWINGDAVEVHSTAISSFVKSLPGNASGVTSDATGSQSFSVHGLFRISAGLFVTNTHSFVVWNEGNALVRIEGGIIETPGFRAGGNQNGRWIYHQSGGFVRLYGDIDSDLKDSGAATFDIKGVDNSFIMSGGDIEVFDAVTTTEVTSSVHLAIRIESKPENISVTGGTVSIVRGDGSNDENFVIDSSAPFHNLVIGGTNNQTNVYLAQRLNILNDLTVKNKGEFDIRYDGGQYDIAIGGNIDLQSGAVFRSGSNTTTFNGNRNSSIINNSGSNLALNNVIVEKDVNPGSYFTVGLEGLQSLNIGGNLELKRGNFDLDSKDVSVKKNISIYKGNILGDGSLVLNGTIKQTLFSEEGKKFSFGNVQFNNSSTTGNQIELLSHARVGKLEITRQSGSRQLIYLGIYNLESNEAKFDDLGWSSTRMFKTSDKSSDGGLTLPLELIENYSPSKIVQFFPVGTSNYTPVTVNANKDFSGANGASGKVTVVPVNSAHPTVAVQNQQSVTPYYWKVGLVPEEGSIKIDDLQYVFDYGSAFTGHTPVVLVETDWKVHGQIANKSTKATFPYDASLNGDFTVGGQGDGIFGNPRVLYSIKSGRISDASTWSANADRKHEGLATTTAPQSYDFLVIGGDGANGNHVVHIDANDNNYSVSQVYIKGRSETSESFAGIPTLDVRNQNGGHNIPIIKGRGRIIYPNKTFINGDHTAFCSNNEAIIEFNGSGQTLEASVNVPFFPNLHFSGSGSWVGPDSKLVVNGNLYVDSLNSGVNFRLQRDAEIKGDLKVGKGIFSFPMNSGAEVYVGGDIQILGSGTLSYGGGNNIPRHTLRLHGNLSQGDGTINFYNSDNSKNVTLYFEGDESVVFSKIGEKDSKFFRIIVDKPEGQIVRFDSSLTLDGPTDTKDKALVINQGVAHFNSSGINIELTSGGGDFIIPSKGELRVSNASVVTVTGNNVGMLLDGKLVVDAGGDAQLNKGTNNYVEYTSSGRSTIVVNGDGELIIGSQLRRSLLTEAGILKFAQNGAESIVVIGDNSAPETDRGVFEILNDGSEFVQGENATLILKNQKPAGFSDLYFNPSLLSLAAGSRVQILKGQELTDAFNIYAPKDLRNLIVGDLEDEAKSVNVRLDIVGVETEENLEIYGISDFDANGLDVVVRKDLINNGSYSHNQNTTSFSGLGKQSISGNTEFYNLIKTGLGELSLGENTLITVKQNIILENGVFNTLETDVVVEGNVSIGDNAYTLSGDASQGVVMQGSSIQNLSGGGTFAKLTINNEKGINVPTQEASVGIAQELRMVKGVLSIGQNLLVLKKGAKILPINSFGSGNMIQTNLSFADAGVMMYLTGESQKIIFPIGAANKYSPVDFNINSLSASNASIRVVAANEHHISVDDPDNVLQYYWTLAASNLTGFSGYAIMTGQADDARVTSGYTVDNYCSAYILSEENLWNKFPYVTKGVTPVEGDLFEGFKIVGDSAKLVFVFDNGNISGDYTAGVEYKNDEDLFQAIPDNIPSYETVAHGLWTAASTWRRMDNGASEVPGRGSIIYVNHLLDVNESNMSALRAYISEDGVIDFKTYINHRMNEVYGKGRLRFARGSLPAGRYDDFFSAEGGTIEFYGNNDYTILGDIPAVNNLVISDGGFKRIASNLTVRGTLGLGVGAGLEQAMSGSTLTVHGDIKNSGGTYLPNLGIVSMKGVNRQNIEGGLDFYDFEVNNPEGVNLVNNDVVVARRLRMLKGILYSSETAMPYLTNADNNEAVEQVVVSSFVSGPLRKNIVAGTSFNFPVGKDNRYGAIGITDRTTSGGVWAVEYFNAMPPHRNKTDNVAFVSNSEYWKVTAPSENAEAAATLRWDDESGINPDGFDAVSIQPGEDGALWRVVNQTSLDKNNQVVGLTKLAHSTSTRERLYSFGLATMPDVGDFTWKGLESADWFNPANWYGNQVPSAGTPAIIKLSDDVNPAYLPIIYGNGNPVAQANDLTIDAGTTLTLDPGARLTVNGALSIVDVGGLQIKHETGEGKMASLLTHGGISGEANVQLTLPKEQWFYLGSSIQGAKIGHFAPGAQESGTLVNVYRDKWYSTYDYHAGVSLSKLEGVAVHYHKESADDNFKELSYVGKLNNDWVERKYTENRFQLLANPYPSFLDWSSKDGWQRADFGTTIWYRMKVGEAMTFITYNYDAPVGGQLALAPAEGDFVEREYALIPPMQNVYVRPLKAGATLAVGNAARNHGLAGSRLKSSGGRQGDVVRIVADNGLSRDGAVVYFADGSYEGLDQGDSEKYKNDDAKVPEVFTRVDGQEVAINGLPVLTEAVRSIPLSVRHQQTGETKLSFDLSYYDGTHNVYFEDKETGAFLNVARNNTYSYRVNETGVQDDRFVLHFYRVTTDLETPMVGEEDAGNDISLKSIGDKVLVSVGMDMLQDGFGTVEIYTIEGRKVQEVPARSSRTLVFLPGQSGVYIVRAVFGAKVKSEMILVSSK